MAFGFDDFSKFFDPISDVLGTSGRKGVGLLQQKPEDIAMAAAAAYLMANGIPVTPEALAAAEPLAAAGPSAALTTDVAAMAPSQVAAMTPEVSGIMQGAQMDPALLESLNAPGTQTAGIGDNFLNFLERNNIGVKGVPLSEAGAELPGAPYGYEPGNAFFENGGVRLEPGPGGPFPQGYTEVAQGGPFPQSYTETAQGGPFPQEFAPNKPDLVGNYGLNYTKPVSSEIGTESNYRLNQDTFRQAGDTNLSTSLPQSKVGLSDPTANVGNRLPTIQGDYRESLTPLQQGMDTAAKYFDKATDKLGKFSDWASEHPYQAAGLGYYTAYKTGMLNQPKQEPIPDNYKNPYTMTGFQRSSPNPSAYQYRPRYPQYAQGGITSVQSYAKGGRTKTESAMDFYDAMNPQPAAPVSHGDPGIFYDTDPDTRYLDPMEASMVRMNKLNSRTNVQAPSMAPFRRMGELDFKPVAAAQGGIMGYAAGGVPMEDEFNRLTGHGNPKPEDHNPEWTNATNAEKAAYYREHPMEGNFVHGAYNVLRFAPIIGPALTLQSMTHPEFVSDQKAIWNGFDPTPSAGATPSTNTTMGPGPMSDTDRTRQENISNLVSQVANGGAPPGPSESEQAANRADVGQSGLAKGGGIMGYNLGSYAAGGNPRLLRGPGDGMSDNIPATINHHQPARLADGEYVITADVVSHLGNGSTEAGAKQLDAMMKRVRKGRTGTPKQGKQIDPRKYLPA